MKCHCSQEDSDGSEESFKFKLRMNTPESVATSTPDKGTPYSGGGVSSTSTYVSELADDEKITIPTAQDPQQGYQRLPVTGGYLTAHTPPGAEGGTLLNNNVNRNRHGMPSFMQASFESPFDLTQPNLGLAMNSPINLLTPPPAPAALAANAPEEENDDKKRIAGPFRG